MKKGAAALLLIAIAACVVGIGAGTVAAVLNGGTGLSAIAVHQVIVGTAANVYTAKTIPDCTDSLGNHLNFTQSSNAFSCGTTVPVFADVKMIPAANCPNGSPGSGWSYTTSTFTAACVAGTNNKGGALQLAPNVGGAAQFRFYLPVDWNTATQPYIRIEYGSGANSSGTVIWTIATSCTKGDGSVSDDGSFNSESAFGTQTMANTNRAWSQSGQLTAVTSGNNCVPGGGIIIKATLSGTASSAINAYLAIITTPTNPTTLQAN